MCIHISDNWAKRSQEGDLKQKGVRGRAPRRGTGLHKSVSVTHKLLKNFINKIDPILKEDFHTNVKIYSPPLWRKVDRLIMINILKQLEIKNKWKGIKSLVSLKTVASSVSIVFSLDNDDIIPNPYNIANIFNNYLDSMAVTTKKV